MTLLKLLFVLLILLPIAFFMMYILDNLLKDAKRAKSNTIDIHDAQDAKRRARNKKKREALLRSVKKSAKRREEQPAVKKPAKTKKRRTAKDGREPQRAKRSSAQQNRPSQSGSAGRSRPSAPPVRRAPSTNPRWTILARPMMPLITCGSLISSSLLLICVLFPCCWIINTISPAVRIS